MHTKSFLGGAVLYMYVCYALHVLQIHMLHMTAKIELQSCVSGEIELFELQALQQTPSKSKTEIVGAEKERGILGIDGIFQVSVWGRREGRRNQENTELVR